MNAKRKGNKNEREVAKWLTEWSGFKFERNRSGSGSWHSNKDAGADITCTDERHAHRCKLSVECKFYKDIKFEHVLLGNKNCNIEKFWTQAKEDAERTNKVPMLVMRYNSMPKGEFFVVIDYKMAPVFIPNMCKQRYMVINTSEHLLYIFMASSIKEVVSYKDVHKLAKTLLKK